MNENTRSFAERIIGQPEQSMRSEKISNTQSLSQAQRQAVAKFEINPIQNAIGAADTAEQDTLQPKERGISRRTVLRWAGLTVVGAAGSNLVLQACSKPPVAPSVSTPTLGTRLYTYKGHSDPVDAVAWSPDGKRIASGSGDCTVQVWDAVGGGHVFTYRGHSGNIPPTLVSKVAWSPDGKRIASGSADDTVQVWDAVGGDSVATDGSHVFIYRGHSDWVWSVAWSPDGKRIASGSADGTVQVWDATDGSHVFTYRGHSSCAVMVVAWSPDGKHIASGGGDKTVQVWNATTGEKVLTYGRDATSITWSPDSKRIASGSYDDHHTVQVSDAIDGSHVFTYRGHSNVVDAVAWSPNGKRIASGSGNVDIHSKPDYTVQVWDATDGGHAFTYRGHTKAEFGSVSAVAWSPDGKRIASAGDDMTVQVWVAG